MNSSTFATPPLSFYIVALSFQNQLSQEDYKQTACTLAPDKNANTTDHRSVPIQAISEDAARERAMLCFPGSWVISVERKNIKF
jgi:hypothetical protein